MEKNYEIFVNTKLYFGNFLDFLGLGLQIS